MRIFKKENNDSGRERKRKSESRERIKTGPRIEGVENVWVKLRTWEPDLELYCSADWKFFPLS